MADQTIDPLTVPGPVDVERFLALAARAYGWTMYNNGEVAGLVSGDMGYDGCATKWGDLLSYAAGKASLHVLAEMEGKLAELAELCETALKQELS